jgi:predicted MFS family arabinose efflux permease
VRHSKVYCCWWFATVLATAGAAVGELYFLALNALESERVSEIDRSFYVFLYAGCGAVTGAAGWYFARLAAMRRASLTVIGVSLLIPYAFIFLVALDKNPIIAFVATAAFGFIFGSACLGRGAALSSTGDAP